MKKILFINLLLFILFFNLDHEIFHRRRVPPGLENRPSSEPVYHGEDSFSDSISDFSGE